MEITITVLLCTCLVLNIFCLYFDLKRLNETKKTEQKLKKVKEKEERKALKDNE